MTRQIAGNTVFVTDDAIKRIITGAALLIAARENWVGHGFDDKFVLDVERRWAGLDAGPIETWEILHGYEEHIRSLASLAVGNTQVNLEKQTKKQVRFPLRLIGDEAWR